MKIKEKKETGLLAGYIPRFNFSLESMLVGSRPKTGLYFRILAVQIHLLTIRTLYNDIFQQIYILIDAWFKNM